MSNMSPDWDLEWPYNLDADLEAKAGLERVLQTTIRERARQLHVEHFPEQYERLMSESTSDQPDSDDADPESLTIVELSEDLNDPANTGYAQCYAVAEREIAVDPEHKCPPVDHCLFCERTLAEAGGRRLTATAAIGVTVADAESAQKLAAEKPRGRTTPLFDHADLFVVAWGDADYMAEQMMERGRPLFASGYRPWFCQTCGCRACNACGAPYERPPGSVLYGNGDNLHLAIITTSKRCLNRACHRNQESYRNGPA